MYKVKVYNEYQMREMLNSGKMQYENFYKDELISFLKFSVDENKNLNKYKKLVDDVSEDLYNILTNPDFCGYDDYYAIYLKKLNPKLYYKCYGQNGYHDLEESDKDE